MAIGVFVVVISSLVWLLPSSALSKRAAGAVVYVGAVTSNQFPAPSTKSCPPTDFACSDSGQEGLVPDSVKRSFVSNLRTRGLTATTKTPSQGRYYEIVLSVKAYEQITPIAFPRQFACDLYGMVTSRGGSAEMRKEVEAHKLNLGGFGAPCFTD